VEIEEVMSAVVDALDAQQTAYMLVGSFSSNFYGIPRATQDVDLVVEFGGQSIHDFCRRLGPRFSLDPQIAFESVTGTTRYILEVTKTQFHVELFPISNDAHDQERFARRIPVAWLGRQVWLPTAEDVIITKLRWLAHLHRNKDFDDVLHVISVQRDRLDWSYLQRWTDQHATRYLLEEIRAKAPDV
jgi:hypothetical protein